MKNFSLLKKLNELKDSKKLPLAEGIKYQQYELEVDGKPQIVNIPLKETEQFEKTITKINVPITRKMLKKILREHRGIRG